MFRNSIIFLTVLFFSSSVFPQNDLGTPVMEPSLNAYIPESNELLFKTMFTAGYMASGFTLPPVSDPVFGPKIIFPRKENSSYAVFGTRFFLSKNFIDPGLYIDYGTAGRNRCFYSLGTELKLGLGWLPFFEPLYLKVLLGYSDFKSVVDLIDGIAYYSQKGFSAGLGLGLQFAAGRDLLFSFGFELRRIFPSSVKLQSFSYSADIKSTAIPGFGSQGLHSVVTSFSMGWII